MWLKVWNIFFFIIFDWNIIYILNFKVLGLNTSTVSLISIDHTLSVHSLSLYDYAQYSLIHFYKMCVSTVFSAWRSVFVFFWSNTIIHTLFTFFENIPLHPYSIINSFTKGPASLQQAEKIPASFYYFRNWQDYDLILYWPHHYEIMRLKWGCVSNDLMWETSIVLPCFPISIYNFLLICF